MAWTLSIAGIQVESYVRPFDTLKIKNRGYAGIGTFSCRLLEQGTIRWADDMLARGPLAWWRLGEASPGTGTAVDYIGVYNGTYVASPTGNVTGPISYDTNTAVTFNGTSQRVTVVTGPTLVDTFSISCWFKRSATQGAIQHLVSYATGGFALYLNAANKLVLSKVGTGDIWVSTPTYTAQTWQHAVATKTGATVVVYVAGSAVAGTFTNQTCASTSALAMAATQAGASWFPGSLDEIALWDRVLTAAEVVALYAEAISTTPFTLNVLNESVISLTDQSVKEFGGYVRRRTRTDLNVTGTRIWEIEGQDYTIDPSDDWVPVGTGPRTATEKDQARIRWLFATYGTRGVDATTAFVQQVEPNNLLAMDFQGLTLAAALDMVCSVTGCEWYVDYNQKLHYFKTEIATAPFSIDVQNPNGTTTFPCRDFEYPDDTIDYVNTVVVLGAGVTSTKYRGGSAPPAGQQRLIVLRDINLLTTGACDTAALAYLATQSNRQDGKFTTWRPGLRAGQVIHIRNAQWGLQGWFHINEVEPKFVDLDTAFYTVSFGSNPVTLGDLWSKSQNTITSNTVTIRDVSENTRDLTAPPVPTGLTLTTDTAKDSNGAAVVRIIATLDQASQYGAVADYFGCYIELTRDNDGDDANPQPVWTQPLKLLLGEEVAKVAFEGVAGNTTYWGRAYSVDQSQNKSTYSTVVSITTAKDLTAPGQPQDVVVVTGFRGVAIKWLPSSSPDLMFVQVRWGIDEVTWPGLMHTGSTVLWLPDLTPDVPFYFQVRAVDVSGNTVTSDTDATAVDYLANPEAGWTASLTATPLSVGVDDIAARSITTEMIATSGLSADVITSGKVVLKPTGTTALEIRDSANALLGFWNPTTGITIYGAAVDDYANLDDGYLRFYKDGGLTAEIGPDGLWADSVKLGALPGGHNVIPNSSFEMAAFGTGTSSVVFTDSTGTPGWKAANRTTAPDNMTESTTLTPTTMAY